MNSRQAPLSSRFRRTGGYTTHDDYGNNGDDTVHTHLPQFKTPKVIQSNASFPQNYSTDPPAVVDVVFFDFIAENVADGLNTITGNENQYTADEFERYMGQEDTLTALLLEYVTRHWNIKGGSCL